MAGNDWPCCAGPPTPPSGVNEDCIQTTSVARISATDHTSVQFPRPHSKRFNYLFHDGHVGLLEPLNDQSGTLANPNGMWTMAAGV
jgi:prepilin-type processing-associated H-X9-DG protein